MASCCGKTFAVLGSSISTWPGITPAGSVFYTPGFQRLSGVDTVEKTWWMQVIRHFGGTLAVNHSLSGSMVSGPAPQAGKCFQRLSALGKNGPPDIILISLGVNDRAFGTPPDVFLRACRDMLAGLSVLYPGAEVWMATLPEAAPEEDPAMRFFNAEGALSPAPYNRAILTALKETGGHAVPLAEGPAYSTVDGVHPDARGMDTLAAGWIAALEGFSR